MSFKMAKLHKVSALARESGRPYNTLLRQLKSLHQQDAERGEAEWMSRVQGGHWGVNKGILRRLHPELFERRYVTRDEYDDHDRRLSALETEHRETRKYAKGVGQRVSRVETQLKLLPV